MSQRLPLITMQHDLKCIVPTNQQNHVSWKTVAFENCCFFFQKDALFMPVLVLDYQYLFQRVMPQQASPTKILFFLCFP